MAKNPDILRNSLIVGAHPDDELLWFSSILEQADKVVIIFKDFWAQPELSQSRARAIEHHPHQNLVCLNIEEAGSYGCADWENPQLNEIGIAFSYSHLARELKRVVKRGVSALTPIDLAAPASSVLQKYSENFIHIRQALRPHLAADMNVFTHNPWGEYGHEDHIQVFRALESLREEIGFTLWMSNYCTERSLKLALHYFQKAPEDHVRLQTNKDYADRVAEVYKEAGCWTWSNDWRWFDTECFMKTPSYEEAPVLQGHLMPLNMFSINPVQPSSRKKLAAGLTLASAGVGFLIGDAF